jgi:hypothetical protein
MSNSPDRIGKAFDGSPAIFVGRGSASVGVPDTGMLTVAGPAHHAQLLQRSSSLRARRRLGCSLEIR